MQHVSIVVRADWDDDAKVWVATSQEIDGLAVEADTIEGLKEKIVNAICDLVELNGIDSSVSSLPVHLMAEQLIQVPNPCH